jgi:hypothetical protein
MYDVAREAEERRAEEREGMLIHAWDHTMTQIRKSVDKEFVYLMICT